MPTASARQDSSPPEHSTSIDDDDDEDDLPLSELVARVRDAGVTFDGTFEDFVAADNTLMTSQPMTDQDIVRCVSEKFGGGDEDEDEDEDDEAEVTQRPAPSVSAALDSCTLLKDFVQQYPDAQDMFRHISVVEEYIAKKRFACKQQTSIRDFFMR